MRNQNNDAELRQKQEGITNGHYLNTSKLPPVSHQGASSSARDLASHSVRFYLIHLRSILTIRPPSQAGGH